MNVEYQANSKALVSYIASLLKGSAHDLQAARPMILVLIMEISHAAYKLRLDEDCKQWHELARFIGMYEELAHSNDILGILNRLGVNEHGNAKEA